MGAVVADVVGFGVVVVGFGAVVVSSGVVVVGIGVVDASAKKRFPRIRLL